MGYLCEINIKRCEVLNPQSALNSINKLHTVKNLIANAIGGAWPAQGSVDENSSYNEVAKCKRYQWVENPPTEKGFENLHEAFEAWDIQHHVTTEGSNPKYYVEHSTDDKLGQEELMFTAIAPFMAEGFKVKFKEEDDHIWTLIHNEYKTDLNET